MKADSETGRDSVLDRGFFLGIGVVIGLFIGYGYVERETPEINVGYRSRERIDEEKIKQPVPFENLTVADKPGFGTKRFLEQNENSGRERNELLMLGILSVESHFALRQAQRETFLSENKFGHRFLFDKETPRLLAEQAKFADVVFLNR